jgi:hypothetical protein
MLQHCKHEEKEEEKEKKEKEEEEEKTKEDGKKDLGKRWAAKLFSALREAWIFFSLTPHLEETMKNNRRKFMLSNFRHRGKFDMCFLAKNKPSVDEVKEKEEEKEEEEN